MKVNWTCDGNVHKLKFDSFISFWFRPMWKYLSSECKLRVHFVIFLMWKFFLIGLLTNCKILIVVRETIEKELQNKLF